MNTEQIPLVSDKRALPHYKVRVVLPGGMRRLASRTEPPVRPAAPTRIEADWLADPDYSNTIACMHWDHIIAVTWRQRPNGTSYSDRE